MLATEDKRIGVYVCECGVNISATVDVEKVVEEAKSFPNVVVARYYKYMCSDPGQSMIKEDIKELNLNRVVVASCSPRMHEPTFRKAIQEAGLNPYFFEMANIREQCSWVHKDREKATEKAISLVSGAVARAALLQPLEPREVPVTQKALVIGGGITGIQAALDIAQRGFKVYLVEKEPSIGGRMAQLDKTFPTLDCSSCILTPKMVDVSRNENIELLTLAEVDQVDGFVGNFKVRIRKKPRYVDTEKCTGCGVCAQKDYSPEEIVTMDGWTQVPRFEINEKECIQCGECVQACMEENEENFAMTNVFNERKRRMEGLEPHAILPKEKSLAEEIYDMLPKERMQFWEEQFKKCIKCYSCREVCPLCVCRYCELEDPRWVKPGEIPPDYPLFHIIRAYHLAGKCIGCGACEAACPMDIPLKSLQDLVRNEPRDRIFDIVPGLSEKTKLRLIESLEKYPIEERPVKY